MIEGLEDRDLKTFQPQIIRRRQTGRPGADDGHLLGPILDLRYWQILKVHLVGGKAFQITDGKRTVHLGAAALFFTGRRTDPPQRSRQGDFVHDELDRFPVPAGFDKRNVALHVGPGRAGLRARGAVMLGINAVGDRYGLGKGSVDGLAHLGGHIPFIGEFNRANLFTLAAPGTIVFDMAGLAAHLYFEVADEAADVLDLTVGEQLDLGFLAY